MDSNSHPEWYLEVDGKKAGPFALDQIRSLLKRGDILALHHVTSDRLEGRWITIEDLLTALAPEGSEAKLTSTPSSSNSSAPQVSQVSQEFFHPPPRPSEETTGLIRIERNKDTPHDPAEDLLDTLQAARDKKNQARAHSSALEARAWGENSRPAFKIPPQVWLICALASLLWVSIWGVERLLQKKNTPGGTSSVAQTEGQTNPVPVTGNPVASAIKPMIAQPSIPINTPPANNAPNRAPARISIPPRAFNPEPPRREEERREETPPEPQRVDLNNVPTDQPAQDIRPPENSDQPPPPPPENPDPGAPISNAAPIDRD